MTHTISLEPPDYLQLAAVQRYGILDTPPQREYDNVLNLACDICDTQMGLLSFLDNTREWFKARRRFPWTEVPLGRSFGLHVIQSDGLTVVDDTRAGPAFSDSPFVTAPPHVRFYAAAPLTTPEGHRIGTLAVLDQAPGSLSHSQRNHLSTLADLVIDKLERRRSTVIDPSSQSTPNTAVLSEDGTILQVNESWISFALANSISDLSSVQPGSNYLEACLPATSESEAHSVKKARTGIEEVLRGRRDTFEMTYPCHAPDEKRWFRMNVTAFSSPGLKARAVVSHTDVTPDEKAQLDARLLETAVEEANDVILITEAGPLSAPGPRITYVNPAFTEVTGYEPEEVIGKTPRLLQGPDTEPWVLDQLREHLSREEPFEGEAINYRKDGTPYVNRWSIAPVYNDDGELTHWVSVQQDVTRRRRVRRQLLQAQEDERRRIGRTMHDEMGGLLASMQMAVNAAERSEMSSEPSSEPLANVKRLATKLSTVVRSLTEQLHSRVLEDYGLSGALTRLVARTKAESGVSITARSNLSSTGRLPSVIEKVAYRGVQKTMALMVEGRSSDRGRILAYVNERALRIRVIVYGDFDQGVGSDSWMSDMGLDEMKHRVERLNGTLEIDPRDGELRVTMTLPVTFLPPPLDT